MSRKTFFAVLKDSWAGREKLCVCMCVCACVLIPFWTPPSSSPTNPPLLPRNDHHQLTLEQLSGGPGEAYGVQKSRQLKGQNYKDEQLLEEDPQHVDRF